MHKVLDNAREHIFDGIVIATPGGQRFVDAPEVARITEKRVTLTIDAEEAARLPRARAAGRGIAGSAGCGALSREDRQQRAELDLGLGQLGRRIGVAHDADARVQPRLATAQERAAQRDAELAVLVGVRPADRPGVPAAVEPLERGDPRRGGRVRLAADRGRRVQQPGELDRAARVR